MMHYCTVKEHSNEITEAERKVSPAMQMAPGADNVRRLALLSIGRIGRQANLRDFPQMQQTLTTALAGSSEDIKGAASLALGGVAIGELDTHLPFIIRQIQEQVWPSASPPL